MEGAQIIDFNWRYIYVYEALLKYSRFTREELIGYTVMERYPGIEKTDLFKTFRNACTSALLCTWKMNFFFPDNSMGWYELSFQPIPDGIFILSVDITERKRGDEKIKKLNADIALREKRFRSIIESSSDIISLTDKNFTTFYRSPSTERITGWTHQEREGKEATGLLHKDDMPAFTNKLQLCLNRPGEPIPVSFRSLHKNGYYVWLEGTITNLLDDESLGAIITNLQDVSLRKTSEEKLVLSERTYRTIASSIPGTVICLLDADYRYLLIEGDMLEKLGYAKEKLLGKTIKEALPPDRYNQVLPNFERVFAGETFAIEDSGQK